jgi:diphosphoinositol-polyphosphate diphosphatase
MGVLLDSKKSTELLNTEQGSQRKGRHLQRYGRQQERLVAGCIPVRGDSLEGVQVLMITSSSGGKGLVFPKGGWETDETVDAAAARETLEEAGVRGTIEEPLLGAFPFHSGKAERLHTDNQGKCIAYMFVMRVQEELPVWPEAGQRNRVWVPLHEACGKCRHQWMREALEVWKKRLGVETEADGSPPCQAAAATTAASGVRIVASM